MEATQQTLENQDQTNKPATVEQTAAAKKPTKVKDMTIKQLIASDIAKEQIALALPRHITPDRMARIAITAATKNPKLNQCTQESVMSCLIDCSQLGLEPDGRKAHLIPYGTTCTLIVDYKGLVELARRSGQVSDIHADVVCENDEFEYSYGSGGKLTHKPALKDRGEVIAAYSFVKLKDGSESYDVMSIDEINKIKARSKSAGSGPWKTDENEMRKKTVFKRHSKWLPLSPEFHDAVDKDYDAPRDITNFVHVSDPKRPAFISDNGEEQEAEVVE